MILTPCQLWIIEIFFQRNNYFKIRRKNSEGCWIQRLKRSRSLELWNEGLWGSNEWSIFYLSKEDFENREDWLIYFLKIKKNGGWRIQKMANNNSFCQFILKRLLSLGEKEMIGKWYSKGVNNFSSLYLCVLVLNATRSNFGYFNTRKTSCFHCRTQICSLNLANYCSCRMKPLKKKFILK